MVKAFFLKNTGGKLKLTNYGIKDPAPNEVRVRNKYCLVSHMDTHFQSGLYGLEKYPAILGTSGAGEVVRVGNQVKNFSIGDKVVYGTGFLGSYSEEVNIKESLLISAPNNLPLELVAASFVPNLMAHCLIFRTYRVSKVNQILVSGATGAIGHILVQWLRSLKIRNVIGVVGSDKNLANAKKYGCNYAVNYNDKDLLEKVSKWTKRQGANVVYDCYGRNMFKKHFFMLSYLGLLVNYGDVTGLIENLNPITFATKSLFYTKPRLSLYKNNRAELILTAEEGFKKLRERIVVPSYNVVDFKDIEKIHKSISTNRTQGIILAKIS